MTPQFVLPSPSSLHFVVVNPNIDTLGVVPLADGSPDLLFAVFGQGSAVDLDALLVHAQNSLDTPATDHRSAWVMLRGDGSESHSAPLHGRVTAHNIQPSDIKNPESKHSAADILNMVAACGLRSLLILERGDMVLHIVERPSFSFTPLSSKPGPHFGVPTVQEFREMWKAWDLVTLGMIPTHLLHVKPIDLRHKCLFYLGHIPTFYNILLSKLLRQPYVEPRKFTAIFERGIDPHVDDPDHCHNHSDVPERDEDWPALSEIVRYRDRVRERVLDLYRELESGKRPLTRRLARTLTMVLEHDSFHIETLLYMIIQKADSGCSGALPPPGIRAPAWVELVKQWDAIPTPVQRSVELGPEVIALGRDDSEVDDHTATDAESHEFGWDNENPRRKVEVGRFKVDFRPITVKEFFEFWMGNADEGAPKNLPASWVIEGGEIKVRTVYGPVPMRIAGNWPMIGSFDELSAYAESRGGRVPTEPELRLFLDRFNVGYEEGGNVGFRNWHPCPATTGGPHNGGRGSNGGVWEWTSTVFDTHGGFQGTTIFPGYSSDFFDRKHHVVLGGSYATTPRLAERRTLRNFYQHNYRYAWTSARVAYDV